MATTPYAVSAFCDSVCGIPSGGAAPPIDSSKSANTGEFDFTALRPIALPLPPLAAPLLPPLPRLVFASARPSASPKATSSPLPSFTSSRRDSRLTARHRTSDNHIGHEAWGTLRASLARERLVGRAPPLPCRPPSLVAVACPAPVQMGEGRNFRCFSFAAFPTAEPAFVSSRSLPSRSSPCMVFPSAVTCGVESLLISSVSSPFFFSSFSSSPVSSSSSALSLPTPSSTMPPSSMRSSTLSGRKRKARSSSPMASDGDGCPRRPLKTPLPTSVQPEKSFSMQCTAGGTPADDSLPPTVSLPLNVPSSSGCAMAFAFCAPRSQSTTIARRAAGGSCRASNSYTETMRRMVAPLATWASRPVATNPRRIDNSARCGGRVSGSDPAEFPADCCGRCTSILCPPTLVRLIGFLAALPPPLGGGLPNDEAARAVGVRDGSHWAEWSRRDVKRLNER